MDISWRCEQNFQPPPAALRPRTSTGTPCGRWSYLRSSKSSCGGTQIICSPPRKICGKGRSCSNPSVSDASSVLKPSAMLSWNARLRVKFGCSPHILYLAQKHMLRTFSALFEGSLSSCGHQTGKSWLPSAGLCGLLETNTFLMVRRLILSYQLPKLSLSWPSFSEFASLSRPTFPPTEQRDSKSGSPLSLCLKLMWMRLSTSETKLEEWELSSEISLVRLWRLGLTKAPQRAPLVCMKLRLCYGDFS